MHSPEIKAEARRLTRPVAVTRLVGTRRFAVIDPLPASGNIGIELGVAAGSFSAHMVQSGRFTQLWGVDSYADGHNVREYKKALRATGLWSDYRLLRMTFDQAVDLFPDNHFDFIYCDGYAHTGEEGGRTFSDWYPKLKPGGVFAGDDYDAESWPLTVWAVNETVAQLNAQLFVTDLVSDEPYNRYPSWYFIKPTDGPATLEFPEALDLIAAAEKHRVAEERKRKRQQARHQR